MACVFQDTLPARHSVKTCRSMAEPLHTEAADA